MTTAAKPTDANSSSKSGDSVTEFMPNRYKHRQAVGIAFGVLIVWLSEPMQQWISTGAIFAILGMIVRMWASGHVKKNQILAMTGPYAYVRHPLYVGNHLIAIGLCLASGLWWSVPAYIVICFFFYPHTIRHEDTSLLRMFPDQWPAWRERTHALIPRLNANPGEDKGEWSFKQSMVANGEPLYVIAITWGLYEMWSRTV
ncbi:MAG: protein-S-isoprenylcysteine O-methyltransferase Ste14 [Planctomycetota bacterium]|jgi:protein-S-isoprenylcysteine O-methyltransferase Ste14